MALKKSEKNLLKALGGVAVVSGVILFRVFNPSTPEPVESTEDTVVVEEKKEEAKVTTPRQKSSSAGGSRGGSSGGGSVSTVSTGVSLDDFQNHNTYSDCWVTIGDDAYNVSNYIANNQTQAKSIGQYCGTLGFEFGFGSENTVIIEDIKKRSQNLGPIK